MGTADDRARTQIVLALKGRHRIAQGVSPGGTTRITGFSPGSELEVRRVALAQLRPGGTALSRRIPTPKLKPLTFTVPPFYRRRDSRTPYDFQLFPCILGGGSVRLSLLSRGLFGLMVSCRDRLSDLPPTDSIPPCRGARPTPPVGTYGPAGHRPRRPCVPVPGPAVRQGVGPGPDARRPQTARNKAGPLILGRGRPHRRAQRSAQPRRQGGRDHLPHRAVRVDPASAVRAVRPQDAIVLRVPEEPPRRPLVLRPPRQLITPMRPLPALLDAIINGDADSMRRQMAETLAYLQWLNRLRWSHYRISRRYRRRNMANCFDGGKQLSSPEERPSPAPQPAH